MHKTILITGASSGIGEATARRFAQAGSRLILNARNTEKLTSLKKELEESYGTEVYLIPFDVRDFQSAEKAIGSIPETFRQIDVLVNNAGLALGVDKEFEGDMTDYETMIDTNIKALLKITQLVVPGMIARHTGHVINIGSIAGEKAYPGGSVYCATKAAVKALTDGLRMDLYDTPIRVTNVKPGLVETNFSVIRYHGDKQKADKVYSNVKPLTGTDIAEVIYFVAAAPPHVQISEIEILATHQASAQMVWRG
jgi:NADP-dependent 3-hydroxy acid dehydrogenase YdfG